MAQQHAGCRRVSGHLADIAKAAAFDPKRTLALTLYFRRAGLAKSDEKPHARMSIRTITYIALNREEEAPALAGCQLARDNPVSVVDEILRSGENTNDPDIFATGSDGDFGSIRSECRTCGSESGIGCILLTGKNRDLPA